MTDWQKKAAVSPVGVTKGPLEFQVTDLKCVTRKLAIECPNSHLV